MDKLKELHPCGCCFVDESIEKECVYKYFDFGPKTKVTVDGHEFVPEYLVYARHTRLAKVFPVGDDDRAVIIRLKDIIQDNMNAEQILVQEFESKVMEDGYGPDCVIVACEEG